MPDRGLVPPGIAYLANNIISRQNIMGSSRETRARWAKGLTFSQNTATIFFAGCGYQYEGQLENIMALVRKLDSSVVGSDAAMKLADVQRKLGMGGLVNRIVGGKDRAEAPPLRDAVKVLQALGVELAYLAEDEPCCGGLLYYGGLREDFRQNAGRLCDQLKSRGVKKIVGIVPSCTYTLRDLVPGAVTGWDIEVKHFSETVLAALGSRDLRFPDRVKVTYHDPCQMSRYLDLVEAPRRIIEAIKGMELVEPPLTKGRWATCCGGGGGFEAVFPELSQMLAVNRARELADTGAEIIVTQCPGCIMQLRNGLKALGKEQVRVIDLAEVLATALGV